ncbi:MAG: aminopeptidase N, partial [Gammaproteobacteria bacterium]|nr:aminopeptidase N [Gammaproteobacteria bacterium]
MFFEVENNIQQPKTLYRLDYKPSPYLINEVKLNFLLDHRQTKVISQLFCTQIESTHPEDLFLDGEGLTLLSLTLNGHEVPYQVHEHGILIEQKCLPSTFVLEIINLCSPINNLALSGLYVSDQAMITQCEA